MLHYRRGVLLFAAFAIAMFVVATATLRAQSVGDSDPTDAPSTRHLCGTDLLEGVDFNQALARTAQLRPAEYARIMSGAKNSARLLGANLVDVPIGTRKDFITYDYVEASFTTIQSVLTYKGKYFRLWVDLKDTARITQAITLEMAEALDSITGPSSRNPAKGMLENDQEVFGIPPVNRYSNDYVTDFLFYDVKDGFSGNGAVLGFFSPNDQSDPSVVPFSNGLNLLYIDSNEGLQGGTDGLLGTIAHEYQHLIHYARKRNSITFLNEGCSEVASILNGYSSRRDASYLNNTNVPMFRWTRNTSQAANLLADYTRAMTWVHYLSEQFGERFLYEFAGASRDSMARVDEALQKIGRTDITWQSILKNFSAALYVQSSTAEPQYRFKFRLVGSNSTRAKATTWTGSNVPDTNISVKLEPFGISYYTFTKPGGVVKLTFSNGANIAVMAIAYTNGSNTPSEIREVNPALPIVFGDTATYERITFAVLNMTARQQTPVWSVAVEEPPSGVATEPESGTGFGIATVFPHPLFGTGTVQFRTTGTEPVTMELFDLQGKRIQQVLGNTQLPSSLHQATIQTTGLAAGTYLLRLRQGGRTSVRQIIVGD
ncbi:MAG: T9SS type A sorting domain-containing protein [Chlorobi bacterium]|nr:MAG: FG-GAP repeat protein [Chlorobi bacterium OLB7]MBK8910620.1 T9SS type A sorting domain-containing protein [Chlorobiota bacterium]MBX7216192.1 T9SS type A sorting domain-containing protein [Candidatus Kapabacteria bacterium]